MFYIDGIDSILLAADTLKTNIERGRILMSHVPCEIALFEKLAVKFLYYNNLHRTVEIV